MAFVVGIGGCTCSGKSALADKLFRHFDKTLIRVCVISQDDYFKSMDEVGLSTDDGVNFYYNYDRCEALNVKILHKKICSQIPLFDLIIVEGNMLTELEVVMELFDLFYFIKMDYQTCFQRRILRTDYDPPDPEGYFEAIVWPAYVAHLSVLESTKNSKISQIEHDNPKICDLVLEEVNSGIKDYVRIQTEPIRIEPISDFVVTPDAGGSSTFTGTTRKDSDSKEVKHLEYEAYHDMALLEMRKLCKAARQKYPSLIRIVLIHRTGHVPIKDKSVVIATSSPHRLDCIRATEFLIDELKRTVPIWKKETFEDDSEIWKENPETINSDKHWK